MQAGKFGTIYLLNRDNLGGRSSSDSGALDAVGPIAGQFNHPAFFADTTTLTSANTSGSNDYSAEPPVRRISIGVVFVGNGRRMLTAFGGSVRVAVAADFASPFANAGEIALSSVEQLRAFRGYQTLRRELAGVLSR